MTFLTPKCLPDGRSLLNIGCGWKTHHGWTNIDFSPYARLAANPRLARLLAQFGLLSTLRKERLARTDPSIFYHDLRLGIPFADASFDALYSSHFFEHVDRADLPALLAECRRAMKPGALLRVVVPDWELLTRWYLAALQDWDNGKAGANQHHLKAMQDLIDQMVRSDASGARQGSLFGRFENWYRGGASGTGELHRWMYDRRSMVELLEKNGFYSCRIESARTSRIAGWTDFAPALDLDDSGTDYKPESLYVVAVR